MKRRTLNTISPFSLLQEYCIVIIANQRQVAHICELP